jgi:hypothetical protein
MISAVIVDSGSGPTTTWSSVLGDETRLAANEHASPDSTIVPVGDVANDECVQTSRENPR